MCHSEITCVEERPGPVGGVGPPMGARVDHLGGTEDPLGLGARRGVGQRLAVVEPVAVPGAGRAPLEQRLVVAELDRREVDLPRSGPPEWLELDPDPCGPGGPHDEAGPPVRQRGRPEAGAPGGQARVEGGGGDHHGGPDT